MNLSKYIPILSLTILTLALNLHADVSNADQAMNKLISEHPPVYDASHLSITRLKEAATFYDPDGFSATLDLGYLSINLEKPAALKPDPGSTLSKMFLGYSDKDSYLQLYLKPATFSYVFSGGEPFGDHIPLTTGTHIIEDTNKNLGKYRITVTISTSKLNIKVARSGWFPFTEKFEDAPIFQVEITKVEKL